ncbi:PLP-dependent aminotransferase family protein [Tumidithrix elongata RA019]|uniref:PLP-dependent aminotransferase family protein n=1 Tax=Tumidithrix elongata BACA0141 TaxID=2716417 RepID=A0AAW9Q4E8_9CYAN|nr:PLP-dependent aminotransferase family protein [Tumidithrix elongata RA019]
MRIPLNRTSQEPIYLQIRDRISRLIKSGSLQPGEQLPSIRALAESVQVNKLTVIEAYGVLEADGLVFARQGAGYFVNNFASASNFANHGIATPERSSTLDPAQEVVIAKKWGESFLDQYMTSLQAQQEPDMIDFTSGFPRPSGLEDLAKIARRAMTQVGDVLFSYDFPQGQFTLRKQVAQMLAWKLGLEVSADDLIITNGSKQALSLALQYHLRAGDWAIVESPTYHGAIALLENLGVRIIGIPMCKDGMNLELLEKYLHSHRPKLIYTISTLHNPTGITTSQAHRRELLSLAEKYHCHILEDNAYEGLNFAPSPAPIKALDRSDLVTYVGTFSKTLMPGLRVGYMLATGKHYQALVEQKLLHDLHVSTVAQAIASEYLASGHYRRHLNHLRTINHQRHDAMLQAMECNFPDSVRWTVPQGGLFIWVQLPDRTPMAAIRQAAAEQKVLIGCGKPFFPDGQGYPALRLNFSQSLENIDRGIALLGDLLKQFLLRSERIT